jgi:hypothetical protein
MTGALVLGTAIVSFALVALRPDTNSAALIGAQAFAAGALIANALPSLRDRLLVPLRWAGDLALVLIVSIAFTGAALPGVGPALLVTVAFVVPVSVALSAALVFDRDRLSALVGAGWRDPVLAIPISSSMQGPAAATLPLVYALVVLVGGAVAILGKRRHSA